MTDDWHVCTHDWRVGGEPIDPEALLRVLAGFDEHFPGAVRSLAETPVTVSEWTEVDA
jgi:hypothetical protein